MNLKEGASKRGRKPKETGVLRVAFSTRVAPDTLETLRRLAADSSKPVSEVLDGLGLLLRADAELGALLAQLMLTKPTGSELASALRAAEAYEAVAGRLRAVLERHFEPPVMPLLEALGAPCLFVDHGGTVGYANSAACARVGQETLVGSPLSGAFPQEALLISALDGVSLRSPVSLPIASGELQIVPVPAQGCWLVWPAA